MLFSTVSVATMIRPQAAGCRHVEWINSNKNYRVRQKVPEVPREQSVRPMH